MGDGQNSIGIGESFYFGEDMSLRVEKQTHRSLARFEVANIRRQNRVQIALVVRPGK